MVFEQIYAGPSNDESQSKVVVALAVERLGDGADGLGVHTPVEDTGPEELPIDRLDKSVCTVCHKELLGHRVHPLPPGLTGQFDSDFRWLVKAVICPTCDAAFCHGDSYHHNDLRHHGSLQRAHCAKCGTSLAGAAVLIFTQAEQFARQNLVYKPGTESLIRVRHDGNEQVHFPERCVTCGSESGLESVDVDIERLSTIRRELVEKTFWWGTQYVPSPLQRSNTAVFAVPFCFRHRPTVGDKLKVAMHQSLGLGVGADTEVRLDGWTLAFVEVWEPWWRPRVLSDGTHGLLTSKDIPTDDADEAKPLLQPNNPKRGLNHPVWFFSFEFDDKDYQRDFVAANSELIAYRDRISWEVFAAELGQGELSPMLRGIARRWADRAHGWVGVQTGTEQSDGWHTDNNGTITFYLDHPGAKKSAVPVATISNGHLAIKPKRLRKKCGLGDDDMVAFDEICARNLGVRSGDLESGQSIAGLDVDGIVDALVWIDDRLDRRLIGA